MRPSRPLTFSCRLAALFAALLVFAADAWAAWPTTRFQVDFAPPRAGTDTPHPQAPVRSDRGRSTMPPAGADDDPLDVFGNRQRAYDALAMVFENYLAEIAEALQAEAYEPPNLPVYRDDAGNEFYRVQLVDKSREASLDGNEGVYHSVTNCGDVGIATGNWFGISADSFVPLTSSREAYLYQVLAHELFHAIQASYPASDTALNGCAANTNDYQSVTEGTAEAIAAMLAQRRWPKYYREYSRTVQYQDSAGEEIAELVRFNGATGYIDESVVGVRRYDRSFLDLSRATADERRLAAYTAGSFWFNLLDRYGITFVDHLLRRPLAHGDWPSLAEWIDGALRSWDPRLDGLYTLYPHFVAEFAGQIGSRFSFDEIPGFGPGRVIEFDTDTGQPEDRQRPGTEAEWRLYWAQRILGSCQTVWLQPTDPGPTEVRFTLARFSASCLDIRWAGFEGPFELYIEAEHASLRLIDQVNLGLIHQDMDGAEMNCYNAVRPHYAEPLWTCTHEKPFLSSGAQPLTYTKRWDEFDVPFTGRGRRLMAISNVAVDARRTRPFPDDAPLVVRVGIADTESRDGRAYDPPYSAFKGMGNPMAGFTDEAQYGITESPTPAMMLLNFGIPLAGGEGQYGVSWMGEPPARGYTGPFKGSVTAPQSKGSAEMVASMLCERHRDGVVGEIVRFDRDHLWIDIDAELCKMTMPPPADGRFPVVDRVQARLRLPFGWRYDPGSAPADLVTPGMEVMIARHARRVPMVLSGAWGQPGEGGDTGAGGGGPGDAGAAAGAGSGGASSSAGSGGTLDAGAPCECTCEELAAFDERAEQLKQQGDDKAMMKMSSRMMACMTPCQRPYMLCRAGLDP
ncbi:hypothetical protein [Elongatibacter sediminis]